ncbi:MULTISPECIES: transposase family protein [Muribaculaceae]|uniref:integrase catalytic domain-containing protein n=1 Tax=Muribaculaceae TaxID=2005473 RepID=UPI00272DA556|nr:MULTISPECIES: transposase family protein [Muribaculaceae]
MHYCQNNTGLSREATSHSRYRTDAFTKHLYEAAVYDSTKYLDTYSDAPRDKAIERARTHAVLTKAAEIYRDGMVNSYCGSFGSLYEAFNTVMPGKYCYHRFSRAMRKVSENGIGGMITDRRGGNNNKINDVVKKWLLDAMSSGKKYGPTQIYRFIADLCGQYEYHTPSLSWVKTNYYRYLPIVAKNRNGNDEWTYSDLPYAGIARASAPGGQWQVDGWRLPFYMEGYRTLMIFTVMDAHSGKVVGYNVDFSENTESILKGIEHAVATTGTLPQEIVSDNHSFHKTMEAAYFKEAIEKSGCTWTVTSNPRHKGMIERSFGTFGERFCKPMYGYVGEGIRTRRSNGRTSQELMDKYHRAGAFLTADQIKMIAIEVVNRYNSTVTGKDGISPAERYGASQNIGLPVDEMERMRLFVRKGEYTVRKGQINISRGGVTYEYQLDKDMFVELNNKKVAVRYVDQDCIYLFDARTDAPLGSVNRKRYAHGAVCDRTDEDARIMIQHKGRLNGIKTAFKRRQIEIAERAEAIDPEAAYAMNAKLTPKNILEEFRSGGMKAREAERLGVNISEVPDIPVFSEVTTCRADNRQSKKAKESPFAPKVHKIGTIKL